MKSPAAANRTPVAYRGIGGLVGRQFGRAGFVLVAAALLLAFLAPFGAPRTVHGFGVWTLLEAGLALFVAGVGATIAWSPLNR